MIPPYDETIRMIEAQFPEMGWLLRNNHDERGKYFFHLHGQKFDRDTGKYELSIKRWGETKELVAFECLCAIQAGTH